MKIKFLPILVVGLLTVMSTMTSCLNSDVEEVTYSSETSITSFSLGTLHVKRVGKDSKGEDSTYTDTISMANYPFTINQAMRTIENKDSLPVGIDISRVITNITADSNYILYGKITSKGAEAKDTLWTSTDSINFSFAPSEGLTFKVLAYSGVVGKAYHVKVNVHTQEPDSLQWNKELMGSAFTSGTLTKQKAVYINNCIYVFGQTSEGKMVAEYTTVSNGNPGKTWTAIALPQQTDTYSATLCQGNIYFLVNQELYKLTDNGYESQNLSVALDQLLTSIDNSLYARTANNESYIYNVQSKTGTTEQSNLSEFPSKGQKIISANIPVSYNNNLTRSILLGYNSTKVKGSGFVATRMTNDEMWSSYNYEQTDTFRCPNIVDPSFIYYNKKLYVFGGEITSQDYTDYKSPFSTFFCSTDNGLTWEVVQENMTFATEGTSFIELYNKGKNKGEGSYSCIVDQNNFIWIIWNNGYMSRGRVNHFGFLPKWE